jgi:hypothetical protein
MMGSRKNERQQLRHSRHSFFENSSSEHLPLARRQTA